MKKRRLQEICSIRLDEADNGMPQWANLVGGNILADSSSAGDLAGGGVYACFWDDALIYIGSFVGPDGDPFGGHVVDRIYKHVMGFTLRARALGFSKGPLRSIIDNLDHPIARDLQVARQTNHRLEGGSIKATYNKARFAARHWEELRDATPEALFERFSFAYRRVKPVGNPVHDKHLVKEVWIKPIERSLIRRFEPICNTEFRAGPDGPHADLDIVAEAFEPLFARPLPESGLTSSPVPVVAIPSCESNEDGDDGGEITPADSRWQEYYTDDGQLRVRAVPSRDGAMGRTLLYRESNKRIICLASSDRLAAARIEAQPVRRGPLVSSVAVDFDGDPGERSTLMRGILEACLAELHDDRVG